MLEQKKIKVSLPELLYLCFVIVMLFTKGIGLYDGLFLYKLFLIVALGIIAMKMCVTKHTLKEWALMLLSCLLVTVLYLNCKEKGIVICTLVVLAMKEVSLDRVFKVGMWTWGITMFGNTIYHLINLDVSGYKVHEKLGLGHIFRWDLGFSHPNVLHISYLVLAAFIVYNLGEKYNWKHILLLMTGNLFIFLYSVSYTGIIVTTLYLGMAWYIIVRKSLCKIEYILLELIFPVCLFLSFFSALFLPEKIFSIMNKIFSNRLILARYYLVPEKIKLLGNNLEQITTSMYTLDNAYLFSFIIYGVLFFLIIIFSYLILIHKFIKMKRNKELVIIVCFLIAGITEPFLFNTSFKNLSLFFLGALIWEKGTLNSEHCKRFCVLPKVHCEWELDVTKLYILKENILCVWKKKWKKIALISGMTALIMGTIYTFNKEMPKGYIMPRIHVSIVEQEKNLWCVENPEDSKYEGIKIIDYTDETTYMQYFDGKIVVVEQVRLWISSVCIIGFFVACICMVRMLGEERRRIK